MIGREITIRRKKLIRLGFATYEAYLDSSLWKDRKMKFEDKFSKKCKYCGSQILVELHHKTYVRLGNETDNDLAWLCSRHHEEATESGAMPRPITDRQSKFLIDLGYVGDVNLLTTWEASKLINRNFDPSYTTWYERRKEKEKDNTVNLIISAVNSVREEEEWCPF